MTYTVHNRCRYYVGRICDRFYSRRTKNWWTVSTEHCCRVALCLNLIYFRTETQWMKSITHWPSEFFPNWLIHDICDVHQDIIYSSEYTMYIIHTYAVRTLWRWPDDWSVHVCQSLSWINYKYQFRKSVCCPSHGF